MAGEEVEGDMTTTQYLELHTLNPEFVKNALGWTWDEQKITIPYYGQDKKLLFCKYRHMEGQKFTYDPGASPALYGVHRVKEKLFVILCEGEADAARLIQEGYTAVTTGSVTNHSKELLAPLSGKEVVILLDNDEPGKKGIPAFYSALESIGAYPKIAELPPSVKDVCEYLATDSPDIKKILEAVTTLDEWEEKNLPEEYKIVSAKDILTRDLPPQEWLIDRMVPVEGFTFIVGSEGTGKSFYALTMANAIATGSPWLAKFPVNQKANVLFIDKENVTRRIQSRMKGLKITGEGIYYLEYPQYFDITTDNGEFSGFADYASKFVAKHDIGVVMIDSFADLMVGNENSAGDTQQFFDALRQLFPGISILALHHANKPSQGMIRTASQKTRGSTNIMAQVYSAFYVEQMPRTTHDFAFEHIKAGDTEKIKKFKIEMEIHEDIYNKGVTKVIGLKYGGEIEDAADKAIAAEEIILENLGKKSEIERSELEEICKSQNISSRTFQDVLKKLKDENIVESIPDVSNFRKRAIRLI